MDNPHNPFLLKKWRDADEILVSLWSDRVRLPGLKGANRASEGESLAWVEGEKDSERIVTIFCVISFRCRA